MKKFIAAIAIAALASVAYGQTIDIVDGHIAINGDIDGLAGLEALSPAGHLSLDFVNVPGVGDIDLKGPFPATASVVANTPNNVVLGVLGVENRISITGQTVTAVGYAADQGTAVGDLTVNLGIGDEPPAAFPVNPVVPEPATGLMAAFGLIGLLGLRRRR